MGFSAQWFGLGMAAAAIIVAMQPFKSKAIVLGLSGVVLLYIIGVPIDWWGMVVRQFLNPVQENRAAIIAGFVPTLLVGSYFLLPRARVASVSMTALLIGGLYCYMGMVRVKHEGPVDGALTILLATSTLALLLVVLPRIVQNWDDFIVLPRIVAIAVAGFIGLSGYQVVTNLDHALIGNTNRFIGVAANPQFAAVLCAMGLLFIIWLAFNDNRRYRVFYLALTVPTAVALLATGSRTGIMMCLMGLCVLGVRRFGRGLLILPLLAVAVMLALRLADFLGIDLPLERLLQGGNTRSAAWAGLFNIFSANPVFGVGHFAAGKSENSWLLAAAAYGAGLPLIMLAIGLSCMKLSITLWHRTRAYASMHSYVDLQVAVLCAYFAGTIFEGYMVGRINAMFMVLSITVISGQLMLDHLTQWELDQEAMPPAEPEGDPAGV